MRGACSGRLTLANPGAILTLLDGPVGSDPAFHVVWCRFRMTRRFLAYNSGVLDTAGIYRLLGEVEAGATGYGSLHLLLSSAGTIGFAWDPVQCVFVKPGLPHLCHLLLLISPGVPRLLVTLVLVRVFGVGVSLI